MKYNIGDYVSLKTFHSTKEAPDKTPNGENFWVLVNKKGVVERIGAPHPMFTTMGRRLLIRFDEDISKYGLPCHNEVPNSLWIFESDLGDP